MIRLTFQEHLRTLQDGLLAMGDRVADAVGESVRALAERDEALAHQIIAGDQEVNAAQRHLEEQALVLIATQQPLATDLRIIVAVLSISQDLERMADHAKGIATIGLDLMRQPLLKPLIDIPRMAQIDQEMIRGQLDAFIRHDADAARELARRDDEVDGLYDQVYRELLTYMLEDPRTITRANPLLWVAHNLERIGDRTTNIGERVVFLVTGEIVELNP
jgi:phosphate transport system protein